MSAPNYSVSTLQNNAFRPVPMRPALYPVRTPSRTELGMRLALVSSPRFLQLLFPSFQNSRLQAGAALPPGSWDEERDACGRAPASGGNQWCAMRGEKKTGCQPLRPGSCSCSIIWQELMCEGSQTQCLWASTLEEGR